MPLLEFEFGKFFIGYSLKTFLDTTRSSIQDCLSAPSAIKLIQEGPLKEGLFHIEKAANRHECNDTTGTNESLRTAIKRFDTAAAQNRGIAQLASYFYAARCSERLDRYSDRDFYDRKTLEILKEVEEEAFQNSTTGSAAAGGLAGAGIGTGVAAAVGFTVPVLLPVVAAWAAAGGLVGASLNGDAALEADIRIEPLKCNASELRQKVA